MNALKKLFWVIGFLAAYSASVLAAHALLSRFFEMTGALMFVVTGTVSLLLLSIVFGAIMSLLRRSQIHKVTEMHDRLTNVLNEISSGNFNVLVEVDPHAPHRQIAEAINNMAQNLGTLEAMRQDFISNVSHEIQSPLTSIGGFAKLLKDESLPPEQRRHYAEIIETESNRLSGLSENLPVVPYHEF